MSLMRKAFTVLIVVAAVVMVAVSFLAAGAHAAAPHDPPVIQYEFSYDKHNVLRVVTVQDSRGRIMQYVCTPPAVDTFNGNYSISCTLP